MTDTSSIPNLPDVPGAPNASSTASEPPATTTAPAGATTAPAAATTAPAGGPVAPTFVPGHLVRHDEESIYDGPTTRFGLVVDVDEAGRPSVAWFAGNSGPLDPTAVTAV